MQEKPARSSGELVEPIVIEVPTQQFIDDLNERKSAVTEIDEFKIAKSKADEDENHRLRDYPYRNVFINGKFIKAAKQEVRGHKVVLVDPSGRAIHTLSSHPPRRKKRKTR